MKALRFPDIHRAYEMLDGLTVEEVTRRLNAAIANGRVKKIISTQGYDLYVLAEARDSPGFRRMKERLGPDAAEKLRQDTIRLQQQAINAIRKGDTK